MKRKLIKALSYLFEIPIKRYQCATNDWVTISIDRGQYKLSTNDAVYSFGSKYRSFKLAFQNVTWEKSEVHRVLVLGYGLGSIPVLLKDKINPKTNFVGVDIDKVSLDFSKEINKDLPFNGIDLVCEDVVDYLQSTNDKFDIICVDVFVNSKIPLDISSEHFLHLLLKSGNPNCLYFFSRLNIDDDDATQNLSFQHLLSQFFINFDVCDTGGNNVYIWTKPN